MANESFWLGRGKSVNSSPNTLLIFDKNEKITVRLLDAQAPEQIWIHNCHDEFGKYVKALCVGDRNGCPFCKVNSSDQHASKKPKEKPYPKRGEYAKIMWVYERNEGKGAALIYVGIDIWKQVDVISIAEMPKQIKDSGTDEEKIAWCANYVMGRNFSIVRTDSDKQVSYKVIPLTPSKFEVTDFGVIPPIENYVKWLQNNVAKVSMATPTEEKKTSGESASGSEQKTVTNGTSLKMKELMAVVAKNCDTTSIIECLAQINAGRKLIDANAVLAGNLNDLSDGEIDTFKDLYTKKPKTQ
jgi:hypothetical protein